MPLRVNRMQIANHLSRGDRKSIPQFLGPAEGDLPSLSEVSAETSVRGSNFHPASLGRSSQFKKKYYSITKSSKIGSMSSGKFSMIKIEMFLQSNKLSKKYSIGPQRPLVTYNDLDFEIINDIKAAVEGHPEITLAQLESNTSLKQRVKGKRDCEGLELLENSLEDKIRDILDGIEELKGIVERDRK